MMFSWYWMLSPVLQSLLLTLFTWGVTMMGAAAAFVFHRLNSRFLDLTMGFGAGVMIASSFWSLLNPALESSLGTAGLLFVSAGFAAGGTFIVGIDRLFHLLGFEQRFGQQSAGLRRSLLLVLAVAVHNIPEGLAIGVAVAGSGLQLPGASPVAALLLAGGIGLQNFTEGASVALPLRRGGMTPRQCFFYGQLSGVPEPISAAAGAALALSLSTILPFLLAFAAGTMIAVVTGELIPASAAAGKNIAVVGVIAGFLLMMVLDKLLR